MVLVMSGKYYLSPYVPGNVGIESYKRMILGNKAGGLYVWRSSNYSHWNAITVYGIFYSLNEAKEALDHDLIEQGYILLTEKQWDKYQLLL